MEAKELKKLVSHWPREAWPAGVGWAKNDDQPMIIEPQVWMTYIDIDHAALLFEASGMRWLLHEAIMVDAMALDGCGRTQLRLSGSGMPRKNPEQRVEGPMPLHAISAAILATRTTEAGR